MPRTKPISVKIATSKVIKALEDRLVKLQNDKANQKINEEKHNKAVEKWRKEVAKLALSAISKADHLNANTRYNGDINVEFILPKGTINLPAEPEKDYETHHEWEWKNMVDEIGNAIRILKMTDEEVVSTSTYNSIAQYL